MRLTVEQFEYIKASESTALLRIAGHWSEGADPGDCKLVATTGGTRLALDPLPQPPDPSGPWRAAYSVPLKRVESRRTRFRLETASGRPFELPRPMARGDAAVPERPSVRTRFRRSREVRALDRERARGAKATARLRAQLETLTAERDRLQDAIKAQTRLAEEARAALVEVRGITERAQREERAEARAELERVQAELDEANLRLAEAEARAREVDEARAEARSAVELAAALERSLAEARSSEQEVRGELDTERERSAVLETSLLRATAESDQLRMRVRTLEAVLDRVRNHVRDSHAQLTAVEEFAQTVRAAVEQTVYGGRDDAELARQRAYAIGQLRRELDSRMARLQHLEEQAQGLRAAIAARMNGGRSMDELFAEEREPQKV